VEGGDTQSAVDGPEPEQGSAGGEASVGDRLEILIAVLLGVTALLTAGAAFLADRDDGRQLKFLQQSDLTLAEANDNFSAGDQQKSLDQTIFVEYALAAQQGDEELAVYLAQLSPDLEAAVVEWANDPGSGETPFAGDDPYYYPPGYGDGEELLALSEEEFALGDKYDERGDRFVLATVILAIALALLGIASVLWLRRPRILFTVGGVLFMVGGAVMIVVNLAS
jgi:hypothetical protein